VEGLWDFVRPSCLTCSDQLLSLTCDLKFSQYRSSLRVLWRLLHVNQMSTNGHFESYCRRDASPELIRPTEVGFPYRRPLAGWGFPYRREAGCGMGTQFSNGWLFRISDDTPSLRAWLASHNSARYHSQPGSRKADFAPQFSMDENQPRSLTFGG
jgi:hypothetical protein